MLTIIATTLFCFLVIPFLRQIALTVGLTDKPDTRKRHLGEIPPVGGIAIFLTLVVGEILSSGNLLPSTLLALCLALVILGVVDDIRNLSAMFRLCVQIVVALLMVVFADVRIESVGSIIGGDALEFGYITSLLFTVMCTVGVINAINMIDGLDGLSGSVLAVTFVSLGVLAGVHGETVTALTLFMITGSLLAFLFYNSRLVRDKASIFLGDAGSMMLGLILVWFLVEMTQGSDRVLSPVAAGWMFGLPLMDTVAVMVGRILNKRSPFEAGRDHLHHRLKNRGFSVNSVVLTMLAMHCALVLVGTLNAANTDGETWLFWLFVTLVIVFFAISKRLFELSNTELLRVK